MAAIYVSLIIKGKKTVSDVPEPLKDEVRQILIERGADDLIGG